MSRHGGLETEIKLRLPADLNAIRRTLRRASFHVAKRRTFEANTLFDNPQQSLSNQGKLIRVRRAGYGGVLTYKGPTVPGPHKSRPEVEIPIADPGVLEEILKQVGFDPLFRYEKYRTEYTTHPDKGTVMLDETPIGNFLEVEGSGRWIDRTARLLGFSRGDYITGSYGYLYGNYCRDRGITPTHMVFRGKRR